MRIRIASIQYHLKKIDSFDEFAQQVNFVIGSSAEYEPHYVLLPELFTTQLLSFVKKEDPVTEIKKLTEFTDKFLDLMTGLAKEYGFYIIGGSHPTMKDGEVYNTAYLFTPEGNYFTQDKVHGTKWEKSLWKMKGGDEFKVFKTKYAPISILICYDIEFPEAARLVSEAGAEIIFVPSCTDDRQGFLRVRYCCQARAIENQIFVAMTGTVGNLPVENMNLHYGQASIMTPSDFPFSRDGIAAEGIINHEQIVIADLELDLLDENRLKGSTIPLLDKRRDVFDKAVKVEDAE